MSEQNESAQVRTDNVVVTRHTLRSQGRRRVYRNRQVSNIMLTIINTNQNIPENFQKNKRRANGRAKVTFYLCTLKWSFISSFCLIQWRNSRHFWHVQLLLTSQSFTTICSSKCALSGQLWSNRSPAETFPPKDRHMTNACVFDVADSGQIEASCSPSPTYSSSPSCSISFAYHYASNLSLLLLRPPFPTSCLLHHLPLQQDHYPLLPRFFHTMKTISESMSETSAPWPGSRWRPQARKARLVQRSGSVDRGGSWKRVRSQQAHQAGVMALASRMKSGRKGGGRTVCPGLLHSRIQRCDREVVGRKFEFAASEGGRGWALPVTLSRRVMFISLSSYWQRSLYSISF